MKSVILLLLTILAFCNVNAQQNNFDLVEDVRGTSEFSFKIHQDLPQFQFVLVGDSVYNTISKIVITKNSDPRPFQTLFASGDNEPPFKESEYFKTGDFNFDGYKDIMLLKFWGATGNRIYKGWIFDSNTMKFTTNEFLSYIYSPTFNYEENEFTTHRKGGYGEHIICTYKFLEEKFVLIGKFVRYLDEEKQIFIEETYQRKNGEMKLTHQKEIKE